MTSQYPIQIGDTIIIGSPPALTTYCGSIPGNLSDQEDLAATLLTKSDLVNGKLAVEQLPEKAIIEFLGEAADQAAMLTLNGQLGDWCIRADSNKVYVITSDDPTLESSWTSYSYPVMSVNGQTGAITLDKASIGLNNVNNTADANKPISLLAQEEFNRKLNITDIVNDLTTGGVLKVLSAQQGVELKATVNAILAILDSPDTNLDTFIELVAFINNNASLIDSVATNKVDKVVGSELVPTIDMVRLSTTSGVNTGDQDLSAFMAVTYANLADSEFINDTISGVIDGDTGSSTTAKLYLRTNNVWVQQGGGTSTPLVFTQGNPYYDPDTNIVYIVFGVDGAWYAEQYTGTLILLTGVLSGTKPTSLAEVSELTYS